MKLKTRNRSTNKLNRNLSLPFNDVLGKKQKGANLLFVVSFLEWLKKASKYRYLSRIYREIPSPPSIKTKKEPSEYVPSFMQSYK